MWVSRNREYSIACNGLVNKLAQIQLEIPHIVYSVPSEVNYLADLFSRAFQESRFLEKSHFALSKVQANKIPPLTNPCVLTEGDLYFYFSTPISPESMDTHSRVKNKISTPKPIKNLYQMFKDCTPEQKYYSALRLLQGWNDKTIMTEGGPQLNTAEIIEKKNKEIYDALCKKIIDITMSKLYSNLDKDQASRMRATLTENLKNMKLKEIEKYLKETFIERELLVNGIKCSFAPPNLREVQKKFWINYSLNVGGNFEPKVDDNGINIQLPSQETVILRPSERKTVDTKIRLFIPRNYYGQIGSCPGMNDTEIWLQPGIFNNDLSGSII
jgi:hypothetical protein